MKNQLDKSSYLKKALVFAVAVVFVIFFSIKTSDAATVPQIASAIGRDLDRQAARRFGQESPMRGLSISVTTPVDLNSLEHSNALSKQLQEELARWFVQAGYEVHEIRKGASVLFEPEQGELLLTRKQRLLSSTKISSKALVSGTYTVTPKNIRFNIKVVATGNREVLAMSTMTIRLNAEVASLLKVNRGEGKGGALIEPTVVTLLP